MGTITVRDLEVADLPQVMDYWFRSPPGFLEGMGVDMAKLQSEAEMFANIKNRLDHNRTLAVSKLFALAILSDGVAIGVHTLVPFTEGDSGILHAHLWKTESRGRGIGVQSYPLACRIFIERFSLQRIIFKTPVQNIGAIRMKEKLGIREVGVESVDFGIIKKDTMSRVFELTRAEVLNKWS